VYAQVKAQLAAGADPNVQGKWGTSALMYLARRGDKEGVRALLNRKANVNLVDVYGSTALLDAAYSEQQEMIPILLAAGADLKDEKGNSLLRLQGDRAALSAALIRILTFVPNRHNASMLPFESETTAWMLLYLGADPNVRNTAGETPIVKAQFPSLMKALLAKGANPNVRNQEGRPLIIDLSSRGQVELTQLVLNAGADPNVADSNGWTGLMYAAENGYTAVAKLLLDHGANPNPAIKDGRTPLMSALSEDYLDMAQTLLAHGARVNVKEDTGWTPLMYAVNRKDATAVKILLARGADIDVRTDKKESLLQLSKSQDPTDAFGVARLLKQAGARR
jgi:ankyrin repeat protein